MKLDQIFSEISCKEKGAADKNKHIFLFCKFKRPVRIFFTRYGIAVSSGDRGKIFCRKRAKRWISRCWALMPHV